MSKTSRIAVEAVVLLGATALAFEIGGRYVETREDVRRLMREGKFARIQLLLLNYHMEHGRFPPARYQPKAGGPVHSWRVLLITQIDTYPKERSSKYNFSEEWNSPGNLAAIGECSDWFSRHDGRDIKTDKANYLTIADGDEWPSHKPLDAFLVTKGKDRFLLVDDPDSLVHWMQPKF